MPTAAELRSDLSVLTDDAARRVSRMLAKAKDVDAAKEILENELPSLIVTHGSAAATVAADWYDDLRDQERIDRRFRAIVAELPADLGVEALVGWGLSPVYSKDPDWPSAKALIAGGLQRRILQASRDTIMGSSIADPSSDGWQRVAEADACEFCIMLESRGAVYKESTVDFGAHDNCECTATPAWKGRPRKVKPYAPTKRPKNANSRLLARQWMEANTELYKELKAEDAWFD